MANSQQIAELIDCLIAADMFGKKQLIDEHADLLLSEATRHWMTQSIDAEPNDERGAKLKWHAELLEYCRRDGAATVFDTIESNRRQVRLESLALHLASTPLDWQQIGQCISEDPWLLEEDLLAQMLRVIQTRLNNYLAFLAEAMTDGLPTALNRRGVKTNFHHSLNIDFLPRDTQKILTALERLDSNMYDRVSLERLIELARTAINQIDRFQHTNIWASAQNSLGRALENLGELTNSVELLRAAETAYRAASEEFARIGEMSAHAANQVDLGNVLSKLGELSRNSELLNTAGIIYRAALESRAYINRPRNRAIIKYNISCVLRKLGSINDDSSVLDEAIQTFYEVIDELRSLDMRLDCAKALSELGISLRRLGELTGDIEAIYAAETNQIIALDEFGRFGTSMDRAAVQNDLGGTLRRLGQLTKRSEKFAAAESAYQAAFKEFICIGSAKGCATSQVNRAGVLWEWGILTNNSDKLREAESAYREALYHFTPDCASVDYITTQRSLAVLLSAQDRWQEVAALLQDLIDRVLPAVVLARSIADQRQLLSVLSGVSDMLAFAYIRLGQYETAFLAAGNGRAILLRAVTAIERLESGSEPANAIRLARRTWFDACAAADAAQCDLSVTLTTRPDQFEKQAAERNAAHVAVDKAYEHLVALLAKFGLDSLSPPNFAATAAAVPEGGALAVLIVTDWGGAFITLRHNQSTIVEGDVLALDDLNCKNVDKLFVDSSRESDDLSTEPTGWFASYERFRDAVEITGGRVDRTILVAWNAEIGHTCEALWNQVVGPLHQHLHSSGLTEGAEVILTLPRRLALLPLHAARRPNPVGPAGAWRYAVEDWIFSIVPSLQTLIDCSRKAAEPRRQARRLFSVTNPTGDLKINRYADFPNPADDVASFERCDALAREQATLERVVEMLQNGKYSHLSFYCHGSWNYLQPEKSALYMARNDSIFETTDRKIKSKPNKGGVTSFLEEPVEGQLTMARLRHLDLSASRLAILGACETGLTDLSLPDEGLGLPTGLLEAGVPAVAATLWSVEAQATYSLVRRFVELQLSGLSPPCALRQAQVEHLHGAIIEPDVSTRKTTPGFGVEVDESLGSNEGFRVPLQRFNDAVQIGQAPAGSARTLAAFGADDDPLPDLSASGRGDFSLPSTEPFFWAAFTMTGR